MEYNALLGPIIGAIGTLAGAFIAIMQVRKTMQEESDKRIQDAIEDAKKELDAKINEFKTETELRLEHIGAEILALEKSTQKDLDFIKESYKNDVKVLTAKIEELRDEIKNQHSSLVSLLTKFVNN